MTDEAVICLFNPIPIVSYPPLNLTYLAAYLSRYGGFRYRFHLVDANFSSDPIEEIVRHRPDVVGFTSLSDHSLEIYAHSRALRNRFPAALQVCGGVHASINPAEVLREGSFDVAVVGEGEETFRELVDAYLREGKRLGSPALSRIHGIAYREGDAVKMTPLRNLIGNLDAIPHPRRDLLNNRAYHNRYYVIRGVNTYGVHTLMGSRGCPYRCIFCCVNVTVQGAVRYHSPAYILDEIEELVTRYRARWLFFTDDTFLTDKKAVRELCRMMIERGYHRKVRWEVQVRSNLIREDDLSLLALMRRAGCRQMDIGFESANPRVLTLIKGPGITVEDHQRALELAQRAGIKVLGTFILATPTETYEEMQDTFAFIKKNYRLLHRFQAGCAVPYPGTRLYEMCRERGLIGSDYLKELAWEKEHRIEPSTRVFSDRMTSEQVLEMKLKLDRLSLSQVNIREKARWFLYNLFRNPFVLWGGVRWTVGRLLSRRRGRSTAGVGS